jgi:hypothetical protein
VRCFDDVSEVRGEVFAHFHSSAVKHHGIMQNWLFFLPGRFICEQSSWRQIKWWACSCLCFSPLSSFSVFVCFDFPCTAHAFFPERLSNYFPVPPFHFFRDLLKSDAVPLSDRIRSDTGLQIKWCKKWTLLPSCLKFHTFSSKICQYYHLPLRRATTISVKMQHQSPNIMDTISYLLSCTR